MKIKILVGETPSMPTDCVVSEIRSAASFINEVAKDEGLGDAEITVSEQRKEFKKQPDIASLIVEAGEQVHDFAKREPVVDIAAFISLCTINLFNGPGGAVWPLLLVLVAIRNGHGNEWIASSVFHENNEDFPTETVNRLVEQGSERAWDIRHNVCNEDVAGIDMQFAESLINLLSECVSCGIRKQVQKHQESQEKPTLH